MKEIWIMSTWNQLLIFKSRLGQFHILIFAAESQQFEQNKKLETSTSVIRQGHLANLVAQNSFTHEDGLMIKLHMILILILIKFKIIRESYRQEWLATSNSPNKNDSIPVGWYCVYYGQSRVNLGLILVLF